MTDTIMTVDNKYSVLNVTPRETSEIYNLYCENNQFYDADLDMMILSDSTSFSYDEFLSILQDKQVRAIGLFEPDVASEDYETGQMIYTKALRGFLVYETIAKHQHYNIVFLETENKNLEYYSELLQVLVDRLAVSKQCIKLVFEVSELREDQLAACFKNNLKKKEMVRGLHGRPDTFLFELVLKSPTK